MGENSFVNASTQMTDLLSKEDEIIRKAAALVSNAILDRSANGRITSSMGKDIMNLIADFPMEYQNKILIAVITDISKNATFGRNGSGNGNNKYKNSNSNNPFERYGF